MRRIEKHTPGEIWEGEWEVFDFNLTNSKSGRPLYFKPERLVELETPVTPGIRGKFLGANGDFFKSITKILRNRR